MLIKKKHPFLLLIIGLFAYIMFHMRDFIENKRDSHQQGQSLSWVAQEQNKKYTNSNSISIESLYMDRSEYSIPDEHGLQMSLPSTTNKTILLFRGSILGWKIPPGSKYFSNCKIKNCFITFNRKINESQIDAAIWNNYVDYRFALAHRYPHTRYIILNTEGPARYGGLRHFNFSFNWTMTYRPESDIPFRYGYVYKLEKTQKFMPPKNKTRLAAWLCSDSNSRSGREQLRKALELHMEFDVYGSLGPYKCANDCGRGKYATSCDTECRNMIADKYKFYLAFEATLCKYWADEKLFTFLQRQILPVVWAGSNVYLIAPPHSFINALDFSTAKDLSDYIKYLDQNDTAYNEYFRWKQHYGVVAIGEAWQLSFCHLCARLNNDNNPSIYTYEDLHSWWTNEQCIDPNSSKIRKFLNITNKVKLPYPKNGEAH